MPKIKKGCDTNALVENFKDFTVKDVADSAKRRNIKKSKNLQLSKVCSNFKEELEEASDSDNSEAGKIVGKKRKRRKISTSGDVEGVSVPLVFWQLLSEHIAPEFVGTFAAICKHTAEIVSTGAFWKAIQKRYCPTHQLKALDVDVSSHEGLRHNVIRGLHLCYSKYKRFRENAFVLSTSEATQTLLQSQCQLFFNIRRGGKYEIVFKLFKRCQVPNQTLVGMFLNDKNHNKFTSSQSAVCKHEEEACHLIRVVTTSFCSVSAEVPGLYLTGVTESPAEVTNCRMNKVCLTFCRSPYGHRVKPPLDYTGSVYNFIGSNETIKVILQPTESVKVFSWYHPEYSSVLNPTILSAKEHSVNSNDGCW